MAKDTSGSRGEQATIGPESALLFLGTHDTGVALAHRRNGTTGQLFGSGHHPSLPGQSLRLNLTTTTLPRGGQRQGKARPSYPGKRSAPPDRNFRQLRAAW